MNYTQLKANIQDICETSFTDDELAMFTEQAEQAIYSTVEIPALRKNVTGTVTLNNVYLDVPDDFLYSYSLAVIDGSGNYSYLINKDVNFIREAYPKATSTGIPKHYAYFSDDAFIVGPTPDSSYSVELHYGYYPESIVTAATTWLGNEFDSALLNGALVNAIRFMKGEPDLVKLYQDLYAQAMILLRTLGAGKLRADAYRSGQFRIAAEQEVIVAITQTMCTSFKRALLDGEMDFSSNTSQSYKIALYTSSATLDATTTVYTTTNEVSGTGYTAGVPH